MSSGSARVAVLGGPGNQAARSPGAAAGAKVPLVRLAAFAALALYGVLRWSTLLTGGAAARLLGLLALALILVGARPPLARRSRVAAAALTVLILIAALPMAGIPLDWVWHVRIAVAVRAIGDGLSTLPQISVPYGGEDRWVRLDMLLGAAILLFDAALLLAFAPRDMEELRRVGVALPLVALAAVPLTAVHPSLAYVDGAVLFVLLAALVWADRISRRQVGGAFVLCAAAVVLAAVVAPSLDRHRGWIDYQALAGSLAPKAIDSFDWSQTYGPVAWPRHGRSVLAIEAVRAEYWKTEDLDVFDGRTWTQGIVPGDQSTPPPSPAALSRWSQTIQVTIKDMRSADVIGAGVSQRPVGISHPVLAGFGAGTWTAGSDLQPGDTYTIQVYTPNPTSAQLTAAGTDYSGLPPGYRTVLLPSSSAALSGAAPQIVFPTFHSTRPVENVVGPATDKGAAVLAASPYAGVYKAAQQLARSSGTPYAFVVAVEHLLARGYVYSETPPLRRYPLVSFLLSYRRGYCQQFAGAMALLLRMGGVPARVSVGFTPGNQATGTDQWLVTDRDAHAWVEAWFPHFGWVRFDPTPPADPALGGRGQLDPISSNLRYKTSLQTSGTASAAQPVHPHLRIPAQHAARPSSNAAVLGAAGGAVAMAVAIVLLLLLVTRPVGSPEALVAELERALARTGRPLGAGATLAEIEREIARSGDAGEYVRMLRLVRFGGRRELPGQRHRRALRRHLAAGGGPIGLLRALWALPPRRRARSTRAGRVRGT